MWSINRFFIFSLILWTGFAFAQTANQLPPDYQKIQITEKLGARFSDVSFIDFQGQVVSLNSIIGSKKPIILNFVYYNCPMLCGLALDGVVQMLQTTSQELGEDFDLLTISIDPSDTPAKSKEYRAKLFKRLGYDENQKGWSFWVGAPESIKIAAESAGFGYRYDPATKEYAHSAALIVLSPSGKIVRYLHGVDHRNIDLKLALLEAREETVNSSVDKILMFCYNYDPHKRGYVLQAINVMKIGGAIVLTLLLMFIVILFRIEKVKNRGPKKQHHTKTKDIEKKSRK